MKKSGLFILFLAVAGLVGGLRLRRLNDPHAISGRAKSIDLYLAKPLNLKALSIRLADSLHVVDDTTELRWAADLLGWQSFRAGHYKIDHDYSYEAFLSKLAKGIQDPITLTVVPGQRQAQIVDSLAINMRFDSAAIHQQLSDSVFLKRQHITPKTLVAHFFPATYEIYWTDSPQKVLTRVFSEFNHQVGAWYQREGKGGMTLDEVLTLASIVEGEALHDEEKPAISGLYHNRLERGMPLQADPTVNFALGEQRRLYFKDYKVDDPYNTYLYKGLPPGPINNPSLSSVKAVLNPADNAYIYMVARPDGYHDFSKTYAEHQRKSAKWRSYLQKKARQQRDSLKTGH